MTALVSDPEARLREGLQRKLTTILSADVAGYSKLMAEAEEATLGTFRGHREVFEDLVAHHDGRVFNTAGDAILAEFPSAVEAVRCATEIQAALRTLNDKLPSGRRVEFRIGVNVGDVIVQGSDLLGDGVNVAARLQAAAEPGGICISGSVYDQIRNKLSLTFRPMGEQSFKNIPQPVRTFSIVCTDHAVPAFGRPLAIGTWRWVAVVLALLGIAGGYFGFTRFRAPPAPAQSAAIAATSSIPEGGEVYGGPICYGPSPNDPARCFRQRGTLSGNHISGHWPGRNPGTTVTLDGEVTSSGDVTIQMHGEVTDGASLFTLNLSGTLDGGKLMAKGNFKNGRTATLMWRRVNGSPAPETNDVSSTDKSSN
jgi:adenylate cyclase